MKDELCKEFCSQIVIRDVPAGFAVGTEYEGLTGDPIGFYVVGPDAAGRFRVEDSGTTVPILEACGADIALESRGLVFRELLDKYGVEYDEKRGELKTPALTEGDVPKAALRFLALLLRLQDLTFLTKERAESTFKEEVIRELIAEIGGRANIATDDYLSTALSDFKIDAIVRAANRVPVALFLVRDATRLYEAMLFEVEAQFKEKIECRVVALVESGASVSQSAFKKAVTRLTPLYYRGEERASISRIALEAIGPSALELH
jgi:hypothetical protein